jgi:MFS family permease
VKITIVSQCPFLADAPLCRAPTSILGIVSLHKESLLTINDYSVVSLFIFFIPYILCEVPSNLLLKNLRPSLYLSGIIAAWGVVTIGMGVTQSFGGLVGCRFLLGVFEAGFFPGCAYLISMSVDLDLLPISD